METQKHTPGPWRAERIVPVGADITIGATTESTGNPHWVGRVYNAGILGGKNSTEAEANARLIAAAPELLEALEYLVMHKPGTVKFDTCWKSNVAAARAAIAKARGE